MKKTYDYLVVGAGFYGAVVAERIANDLGRSVLVIDRRSHVGGNCYSEVDEETGIEFHRYGTHIFHTDSREVWDYLARFTEFNGYHHQVLTMHRGRVYQMPINLETINAFYGRTFRPAEARAFLEAEIAKEGIVEPRNLEEKAISLIGRPMYEAFIKGYTIRQWRKDPRELSPDIIKRLPVRFNYREDYFNNCRWQGIPLEGYAKIFERLLDSPRIDVELDCDFFEHRDAFRVRRQTIYTGPIDRYFDDVFGKLDWRTVRFEREVRPVGDYQGTAVMNHADADVPFTRVHEPRHLHPERPYRDDKTLLFYESSDEDPDEPYYPTNTARNRELFAKYEHLAARERGVLIGGRLGRYAYFDMDRTILEALRCYREAVAGATSRSAEVSLG